MKVNFHNMNEIVSAISSSVVEQGKNTTQISGNVGKGVRSVEQVNRHVETISGVSGAIEGHCIDIKTNTGNMVDSINNVFEKADHLASLALQLKQTIGTYKV